MVDLGERGQFLNMCGLFEGGLLVVAVVLGYFLDVNPLDSLTVNWQAAVVWGVAAALPMFGLFVLSHRFALGPLKPIRRFLVDMLGPSLAACRWYDLILLAALAGLAEEALFRGLLQTGLERFFDSAVTGLIVASILFGLAHLITPLYGVLAAMMGFYLGWLFDASGERTLLVPVITHGLYDYLAFLVVVHTYRRQQKQSGEVKTGDGNDAPND